LRSVPLTTQNIDIPSTIQNTANEIRKSCRRKFGTTKQSVTRVIPEIRKAGAAESKINLTFDFLRSNAIGSSE
jgi:hypothetical protein